MKKQTYRKMTDAIRSSPKLTRLVIETDQIFTKISYIIYPLFMIFIFVTKEPAVWQALLIPAISFIAVSVFRSVYSAPRPYEAFDIEPIIPKKTCGNSFPSRHVFSIFVIAVTVFYFYPLPGVILGIAGVLMAAVRVVGGVHFLRDVIAGAFVGIACGAAGFYILPAVI